MVIPGSPCIAFSLAPNAQNESFMGPNDSKHHKQTKKSSENNKSTNEQLHKSIDHQK